MKQPTELLSRSFLAMTGTQFLGAFNDNAFKLLVLLLARDLALEGNGSDPYTPLVVGLFALPFVLFSGFAGLLADRFSKRRIIVLCKVAEIAVMVLAAIALELRSMPLLTGVVFLMGSQSAFFGPAKYGVLPELLPERKLARGNGIILMTTFLAIILGMTAAGELRQRFGEELGYAAGFFIAIALVGTATSLAMRPLPASDPGIRLRGRVFGDLWPTLKAVARKPDLRMAILASSYFWFMGAFVQTLLPTYATLMELDDRQTGWFNATISLGIAAGSLLGAIFSKGRINFSLCYWGLAGMILCLFAMVSAHQVVFLACAVVFVLGIGGGLFGLPLQAYIQARAEPDERGRLVAAANFCNWVFICLSAPFYWLAAQVTSTAGAPGALAGLTLLLAPLAVPGLHRLARSRYGRRES